MKKIDKKLLISIFILIIIMITGFYFFTKEDDETDISYNTIFDNSNETKKSLDEEKIFVDIKGSVKTPGVYELNINSRVIDAIKASGGLNKDANTNYINLSKKLEDGDVIIIYSNKEVEESQKQENIIEVPCDCSNIKNETKEEVKPSNNKININTASLEELQTLNGIGESKAALIIEYRTSNGKFKSIEELKNICYNIK